VPSFNLRSILLNSRRLRAYRTDAAAWARIQRAQLGKRILFADQPGWTDEQIVLAYRSPNPRSRRPLPKCPPFLSWEPMFYWTDSKARGIGNVSVLVKLGEGPKPADYFNPTTKQ
jgi:hypothetical protein